MDIRAEKIDPDRAKELLSTTRNRRLHPPHVARLARDITAGDWRPHSVIHIAETPDGEVLIDGQHRMAAVVAAGMPAEFVVMRGLTLEDQQVIDTGRNRSLSDTLTLHGETNTSVLASAISWLWRRQRRAYLGNPAPTIAEGLKNLRDNPALRQSITPTRAACRTLRIPAGLGTCLHYEMARLDSESADDFWRKVGSAIGLHERHPIYLLRSRLEANAVSKITRLDTAMIHALIIKAWNAYLRGDEMGNLRWLRGGAKPEAFPELEGPQE